MYLSVKAVAAVSEFSRTQHPASAATPPLQQPSSLTQTPGKNMFLLYKNICDIYYFKMRLFHFKYKYFISKFKLGA